MIIMTLSEQNKQIITEISTILIIKK